MANPVLFKNCFVGATTGTGGSAYTEFSAVKSAEMPLSKAELGDSIMGDVAETYFPGLISAPVTLTHRQDFGTAGVDQFWYTRWNAETAFKLRIKPVDAARSTSNPSYDLSKVRVFSITPISGAHGVLLEMQVQLRPCSGCTLARYTSAT